MKTFMLVCLLSFFAIEAYSQTLDIAGIFNKREDVDFTFKRRGGGSRTFKYFMSHDTLYLKTHMSDYRVAVADIDFAASEVAEDNEFTNSANKLSGAFNIKPKSGSKFLYRANDQFPKDNLPVVELDELSLFFPTADDARKVMVYLKKIQDAKMGSLRN